MKQIVFDTSNKKRLFWLLAVPILIGITAVFFRYLHVFSCPFRSNFGILCVGCGITRAFGALIKGHILQSIRYNPLALLLSIVGILFYTEQWCRFFGKKITLLTRNKYVWFVITALYVTYCVLRNIPALAFISNA